MSCRGRRGSQGSEPYSPYDFSEDQEVPESEHHVLSRHSVVGRLFGPTDQMNFHIIHNKVANITVSTSMFLFTALS